MDFYLSSKSLSQIKEAGIEDDFEFKILDKSIFCNVFTAIFFSRQISKLYRIDPTIRQYTVQFPNTSIFYNSTDELKDIIQRTNFIDKFNLLLKGEPIKITTTEQKQKQESAQLLIEFGQLLQNDELISKGIEILDFNFSKPPKTIEKAFELIKINRQLLIPMQIENAYDTISSNFYAITQSKENQRSQFLNQLKEMREDELDIIFSSEKLQIESEDSFFSLICEMGEKFYFLFDYVEVDHLSTEKVGELIEYITNYEVLLHPKLWSSICRRLMIDVSKINKEKNENRSKRYKNFDPTICQNGIFNYLQQSMNCENVFLSKVVQVEVSAIESGEIKNLFDHSKSTYFRVRDPQNVSSFIVVDFKNKKVSLSKYYFSVTTIFGIERNRPKSWLIEGSNDKNDWEKIDERSNDSSLTDYGSSNTFSCKFNQNKFYRFIRIKEIIGQHGGHEMLLSEVEFYGSILSN